MSFTGKENHDITLDEAVSWTRAYRANSAENSTKAHFFGKDAIQAILDQEQCVGIRVYYALDPEGKQQLIIVGADANEQDLHQGKLAERSFPCPPLCDSTSPLIQG